MDKQRSRVSDDVSSAAYGSIIPRTIYGTLTHIDDTVDDDAEAAADDDEGSRAAYNAKSAQDASSCLSSSCRMTTKLCSVSRCQGK